MIYEVEMTDTFGGEASYCWVRRERFEAPSTASTRSLVRLAKKAMGVTGKHQTENHGGTIAIYPRGACIVIFIEPIADLVPGQSVTVIAGPSRGTVGAVKRVWDDLNTLEIMTDNGTHITRVGDVD